MELYVERYILFALTTCRSSGRNPGLLIMYNLIASNIALIGLSIVFACTF